MSESLKKELPAFRSEAEEAKWWFDNRETLAEDFVEAIDDGRVTRGAMMRRGVVRTASIDLDPEDFSQAKMLAEKRGLRYQTYLRLLIHDALQREAKLVG